MFKLNIRYLFIYIILKMFEIELINRYSIDFEYKKNSIYIHVYDNFKKINYGKKIYYYIDFKKLDENVKYTRVKSKILVNIGNFKEYLDNTDIQVFKSNNIIENYYSRFYFYITINEIYKNIPNNVTYLRLEINNINDIKFVYHFKNLKVLHLVNKNKEKKIYYNLDILKLTLIKELCVKNLKINSYHLRVSTLEKLYLKNCSVGNLDGIKNMNIKYLILKSLNIEKIPYLPFLLELSLINCNDIDFNEDDYKYLYKININ